MKKENITKKQIEKVISEAGGDPNDANDFMEWLKTSKVGKNLLKAKPDLVIGDGQNDSPIPPSSL